MRVLVELILMGISVVKCNVGQQFLESEEKEAYQRGTKTKLLGSNQRES